MEHLSSAHYKPSAHDEAKWQAAAALLCDVRSAPATVSPTVWRSIASVCTTRDLPAGMLAHVGHVASLLRRHYAHCFRFALEPLAAAVTAAAARCLEEGDSQTWAQIVEESAGTMQHAALHNPARRKVFDFVLDSVVPAVAPQLAALRASAPLQHLAAPIEAALEAALFHPSSAPSYVAIFSAAAPAAAEPTDGGAADADPPAPSEEGTEDATPVAKKQRVADARQPQKTCQQRLLEHICKGLREANPVYLDLAVWFFRCFCRVVRTKDVTGAASAQRASFGVLERLLESADAACATLSALAAPAGAASEGASKAAATPGAKRKGKAGKAAAAEPTGIVAAGAPGPAADAWARVCDVVSGILREMQLQGLYSGVVDPKHSALLATHADTLLAQAGRLAAADAAGAAPAAVLLQVARIAELGVALLMERLPLLWPLLLWRAAVEPDAGGDGDGVNGGGGLEAFCEMLITAHADKRMLPALVPIVTSALCGAAAGSAGAVACERHRAAATRAFSAWSLTSVSGRLAAAVSAAPAAQAAPLVTAVLESMRAWEAAGLAEGASAGGSELALACCEGLAAVFSVVLDNLNSTLEAQGAVATVAEELTRFLEGLLQTASARQPQQQLRGAAAAALPRISEPQAALLCHVLHAAQALLSRCLLSTPNALHQPAPPAHPAWAPLEILVFPSEVAHNAVLPWLRLGVARLRIQHTHLEALAHPPVERPRGAETALQGSLARLVGASVGADAAGEDEAVWDGVASHVHEGSLQVALRSALAESLGVWGCLAGPDALRRFASLLLSALSAPRPAPPPGSVTFASVSAAALSLASLYEEADARSALLEALSAELRAAACELASAASGESSAASLLSPGAAGGKKKGPQKRGSAGGWTVPEEDGVLEALGGGWLTLLDGGLDTSTDTAAISAAARRLAAALSLPLLLPPGCLDDEELARLAAWAWFCDGLAVRCACAPSAAGDQHADVWRLACVAREVSGRLLLSGSRGAPAAGVEAGPLEGAGPLSELSLLALPWAISSATAVGRAAASVGAAGPSTSGSTGAAPTENSSGGLAGAATFILASGQCVRLLLGRASAKASSEALTLLWGALDAGGSAELAAWAEILSSKSTDKSAGSTAHAIPRSVMLKMEAKAVERKEGVKPSVPLPSVAAACTAVLLSVAVGAARARSSHAEDAEDVPGAAAQAAVLPLLPALSQALLGRWGESLAAAAVGSTSAPSKHGQATAPGLSLEDASLLSAASAAVFAATAAAVRAGLLPLDDAPSAQGEGVAALAPPDLFFRFLNRVAASGCADGHGPAALMVPQAMDLLEATLVAALTGGWGEAWGAPVPAPSVGVVGFEAGFATLLTAARVAAASAASAAARSASGRPGHSLRAGPSGSVSALTDVIRASGLQAFRGVCSVLSAHQVERAVGSLTAALVAASSQPLGRGSTAASTATAATDLLLILLQAQGSSLYNASSHQLQAAVGAALGAVTAPQWEAGVTLAGAEAEAAAIELSALRSAVCALCSAAASRPAFPLSTHALGSMLRLPALIFGRPVAEGATAGAARGSAAAPGEVVLTGPFIPCCELLSTLLRHRSHQVHRLLPGASASLRSLVRALLQHSTAGPHGQQLGRGGAGGLDAAVAALARVFEVSSKEKVVNNKYCAYWLGDYVSECCAAGSPVLHHDALAPLSTAAVGLLAACADNDLQHLHAALSAGGGGVRQLSLGQLREENRRTQYTGKV